MKTDECKELAGWISLVHPEILDEFTATKKKDPDFLNLAPSQQYFDTKKEIDALIEASKYDFTQKCIKPHSSGIIIRLHARYLPVLHSMPC